jgi:flagellar motor switch protein FliN/FliY
MSDETDKPESDASQDDIDALMADADTSDESSGGDAGDSGSAAAGEMNFQEIEDSGIGKPQEKEYEMGAPMANDVTAIYDIPVQISAVLGRSSMQVSQLLKLGRGAVVELDRKVGEAIDIYVNNRLVARGEVVVVEDRLGVTMTEIVKSDRN